MDEIDTGFDGLDNSFDPGVFDDGSGDPGYMGGDMPSTVDDQLNSGDPGSDNSTVDQQLADEENGGLDASKYLTGNDPTNATGSSNSSAGTSSSGSKSGGGSSGGGSSGSGTSSQKPPAAGNVTVNNNIPKTTNAANPTQTPAKSNSNTMAFGLLAVLGVVLLSRK